ncbi:MAG: ABC transporter, permease protein 2 (cluster 1, maltose/g3p/polyamine/iron), partial [uncultured Quadrisphaera sp.]
ERRAPDPSPGARARGRRAHRLRRLLRPGTHPAPPEDDDPRHGDPRRRRGVLPRAGVLGPRRGDEVHRRPLHDERLLVLRLPAAAHEPAPGGLLRRRPVPPVAGQLLPLRRGRSGARHLPRRGGRLRPRHVPVQGQRPHPRRRPRRGPGAGDGDRAAAVPALQPGGRRQHLLERADPVAGLAVRRVPVPDLLPGGGARLGRRGGAHRRGGRAAHLPRAGAAGDGTGPGDGAAVPDDRHLEQLPAAAGHARGQPALPGDAGPDDLAGPGRPAAGVLPAHHRRRARLGGAARRPHGPAPALLARRAHRGSRQGV